MGFAVSSRHTAATVKRRIFDPEEISREVYIRQREGLPARDPGPDAEDARQIIRHRIIEQELSRQAANAEAEARRQRFEAEQALRISAWMKSSQEGRHSPRRIIQGIAYQHGFTIEDIVGPSRNKKLVVARYHAIWEVKREYPSMSLPQLGRHFGGRDHTSQLHALRVWPKKAAALGIECLPIIKDPS